MVFIYLILSMFMRLKEYLNTYLFNKYCLMNTESNTFVKYMIFGLLPCLYFRVKYECTMYNGRYSYFGWYCAQVGHLQVNNLCMVGCNKYTYKY